MSKHTPGPWRLLPREGRISPGVQRGSEGGFLVQGTSRDSEHADARLIAAAPDLLEALKAVLDSDMAMREEDEGTVSKTLQMVRAAIAKAEGT